MADMNNETLEKERRVRGASVKSMNGCGETSSLHTILVSLPEIGAAIIQTGIPALQLSGRNAELNLHLAAVIALDDGVILLARRDGVRVDLGVRGRGSRGPRGGRGGRTGRGRGGLSLGSLGDCNDGGSGDEGGRGAGASAGGSGSRGLRQNGGHTGGIGRGGSAGAGAARGRATAPVGAGKRGDGVVVAATGAGGPAEEAVGNVRGVAVSCDAGAQVTI